jgi:GT2 family glycosyltransferase/tetratricopeptide (TPR) repeat protein
VNMLPSLQQAQVLYREGAQAWASGAVERAAEQLEQACAADPSHAAAHHLLGKVQVALGDAVAAELLQRRSCELDPRLGWNWFALAELLLERGLLIEAVSAFAAAMDHLPDQPWIAELHAQALVKASFSGEQLSQGLGPHAYRIWVEHLEPRPPLPCLPLRQRWWIGTPPSASVDGWLVLLAEDAHLRAGALQALEACLSCWSGELPDLIYGDEDRISPEGTRTDPWFKPGWVEESFWSTPWLDGVSVWRLSWLRHAGLASPPDAGSDRFAWVLSALERKPRIGHLPQVLVHRTALPKAASVEEAQLLAEHLETVGERGVVVAPQQHPHGSFRLTWPVPKAVRCRVIIPSRDRADLLSQCVQTLLDTTTGLDVEIVVVDNGSITDSFHALIAELQGLLGDRFACLSDQGEFNWSRLNNQAAFGCNADVLLFLNNDIEADRRGWMEEMIAQAMRPAIGCVGAVLRYPDGSLQHAGVVVGMHGGADHAYRGLPVAHQVHRARSRCLTGWGAVTGACLMVRRALFEQVGGFDQRLPVEFNDIDFCLRLGQLGYRHVVVPEVSLVHHESQSRDAKASATAEAALRRMQVLWGPRLASAAPWWPPGCETDWSDGRPRGFGVLK